MKLSPSILAVNRAARHNFEILEEFEAGIVLTGVEAKAARVERPSLNSTYVSVRRGEAWLLGCEIPKYRFSRAENYNSRRDRKLLLTKKELEKIEKAGHEKGTALVALKIFTKKNRIKLKFAIARGKKMRDKRQTIKSRDIDRELRGRMKAGRI